MNDVLFVVLGIVLVTLAVFYPLGVTVAAARVAYRHHGAVPALATTVAVGAAWFMWPGYTLLGSIPLLLVLKLTELVRKNNATELPRAIVATTCHAPR
jgi:predicted ABC-type sugar transport system permease subunit